MHSTHDVDESTQNEKSVNDVDRRHTIDDERSRALTQLRMLGQRSSD